jgi:DNA-binding protein HU-beta
MLRRYRFSHKRENPVLRLSKAEAERTVSALIEVISETLKKGDSLALPGFGTFEMRDRGERTGRNPKTGKN